MKEDFGLINDGELNMLFEKEYDEKLVYELSKTEEGKRISSLQKIGINISLKQIANKYIEKNGRESDEFGNIHIDKVVLSNVYNQTIEEISLKLGYKITDFHIERVGNVDNVRQNPFENENKLQEKLEEVDKLLEDIGNKNIDEHFIETNDIAKILEYINDGSLTEEQIKSETQKHEESSIKNNLENEVETLIIEYAYDIRLMQEPEFRAYLTSEENIKQFISDKLELLKELSKNSKFGARIKDENGEITEESVLKFIAEFEQERNSDDLYNKITKYLTYDASQIDDEERGKVAKVFVRAENSKDPVIRNLSKEMARRLGFDVIVQNSLSKKKIEDLCKEAFGDDCDVAQLLEQSELNYKTAAKELENIREAIKIMGQCDGKTRTDILKYRENSARVQKRICSEKEKNIFDVLNSVNAGYTKKNEYSKDEYVKIVVSLYCKFREEEISSKNNKFQGLSHKSFNREGEGSNSSIVRKFMQENSQYFGKYLKDIEKVNATAALEMLKHEEMSTGEFNKYLIAYKQITSRNDKIVEKEKLNADKVNNVKDMLRNFLEKRDNEGIVDEKLQDEIFKAAKKVPPDVFSTEMLTKLEGLDPDKFRKTFKKSDAIRSIGQNTAKSMYFAAARLFSYVPMLIHSANTEGIKETFLPTIKRAKEKFKKLKYESPELSIINFENDDKRPKGVKKLISKIFGKKNKKLLGAGSVSTERQEEQASVKNSNSETDFIKVNYGAEVDEKKAIKELSESQEGERVQADIEK